MNEKVIPVFTIPGTDKKYNAQHIIGQAIDIAEVFLGDMVNYVADTLLYSFKYDNETRSKAYVAYLIDKPTTIIINYDNTTSIFIDITNPSKNHIVFEGSPLYLIKGDATEPIINNGTMRIIAHVCNDIGAWGAGFVLALNKKWSAPMNEYLNLTERNLGDVQFVHVDEYTIVANIIGQHLIGKDEYGLPPIRYSALKEGLKKVNEKALELNATVHVPELGCGLAGGVLGIVMSIIEENMTVPTYMYHFDKK